MNAPGPNLNDFQAAKAAINAAELSGRIGKDTGATVSYREDTGFELTWWFAPDPNGPPTQVRHLDNQDLALLLDKLHALLKDPNRPATLDTAALEIFCDLIERYLGAGDPLLTHVKFGQAVEEIFGGTQTVTGHIGLGIDVAGTIHEAAGIVTWEHHIVPLPPGPFRPLTPAERDALKESLKNWLEANPNAAWALILNAL